MYSLSLSLHSIFSLDENFDALAIVAIGIAIVAGVVGTSLPVVRAANANIVKILRGE